MGLNVASRPQFQQVSHQKHHSQVKGPNETQNVSQPQQAFPQADQTQPQLGLPAASGANQQQQPSIQDVLQMVLMLLQQSQQGGNAAQLGQSGQTPGAQSC